MARPVVQDPGDQPSVARTSPLYCRYNGFLARPVPVARLRRVRRAALRRPPRPPPRVPARGRRRRGDPGVAARSRRRHLRRRPLGDPAAARPAFARAGGVRDPRRAADALRAGVAHRRRDGGGDAARDRAPARRLRSAADRSVALRRAGARSRPRSRPGAVARLPARDRRAPAGRERHGVRRHAVHGARMPATTRASIGRRSSTAATAPSAPGTDWPARITPISSSP